MTAQPPAADAPFGRPPHVLELRVYYEDTDLAGIVYYANYLKYIERGRTEFLRAAGVDQSSLKRDVGVVFVVRRVEIEYRAPARFDDLLSVRTAISELRPARLRMRQSVSLSGADGALVEALVEIAAIDATGRAVRVPEVVRAALSA